MAKNIPNQKGKSTNKKPKKNEETNDDKEDNDNEADKQVVTTMTKRNWT